MLSNVTLICRAAEVLEDGSRMVEIEHFNESGDHLFRFKVRHWFPSVKSKFAKFPIGTLLMISGRLENDVDGNTIILAEKIEYLDKGDKEVIGL